jgi:pyruvate,orthophosphate dikinase
MIAAAGILTSHGGKTSHAAVVARGMGKPCVCGADSLDVDTDAHQFTVDGEVVHEGDLMSIDGTSGKVYLGELSVEPSPVVRHFEGELSPEADPLVAAVHRLLAGRGPGTRCGPYRGGPAHS